MSEANVFFDTSVLLYLLSGDALKADRTEDLLAERGVISVQVLNEFAAVAVRKLNMSLTDIRKILETVRAVCTVQPLTVTTHERGLDIKERYGFSLYDSMIVASALIADALVLYSEDMQDGQLIDGRLRVSNPFIFQTGNS